MPATPHAPPNCLVLPPVPLIRQLGTPGTLLPLIVFGNQGLQFGQFGSYGIDELLLPNLSIENPEARTGSLQQMFTVHRVFLHISPVLAHQLEQSAHLPLSLPRPPACLEGAEASTRACAFTRACGILRQTLSAMAAAMEEGCGGVPNLVKSRADVQAF